MNSPSIADPAQSYQLAQQLIAQKRFDAAQQILLQLKHQLPNEMAIVSALGTIAFEKQHWESALSYFKDALLLAPSTPGLMLNLANTYIEMKRFDAAIDPLTKALALQPEYPRALLSLGTAQFSLGNTRDAIANFEKALRLQPDNAFAAFNLGACQLQTEQFDQAWKNYAARWRTEKYGAYTAPIDLPALERLPENGDLSTVLIWGEQGVGDEILFVSALAVDFASQPLNYWCHEKLLPLFKRSMPNWHIVPRQTALNAKAYSHQIALADLTGTVRSSRESFERQHPFLIPDLSRAAHFKSQLGENKGPKIGLSWHSTSGTVAGSKSIELSQLLESLHVPTEATLIDLQYGSHDSHAELFSLPDLNPFDDLDGLAALISELDLVITISNVTAHIAAGLGKPVFLLLTQIADWRWGLQEQTAFYPSIRIFRQQHQGDWTAVLTQLNAALAEFYSKRERYA